MRKIILSLALGLSLLSPSFAQEAPACQGDTKEIVVNFAEEHKGTLVQLDEAQSVKFVEALEAFFGPRPSTPEYEFDVIWLIKLPVGAGGVLFMKGDCLNSLISLPGDLLEALEINSIGQGS